MEDKLPLTDRLLDEIVKTYSEERPIKSDAYPDGGCDPLWPRFERAVSNQSCDGTATLSRYAIWANTVRDNIIEGLKLVDSGDAEQARYHLTRAANSLSAFSEVQRHLDPMD